MIGRRGFSLVEVIVVIAIIGLVAAVVVPRLPDVASDDPLTIAATSVTELLRSAHRQALERARPVTLDLSPATRSFTATIDESDSMLVLAEGTLALPPGVTLASAGARASFRFSPSGMAVGETLHVRGARGTATISVDRWTGAAHVRR